MHRAFTLLTVFVMCPARADVAVDVVELRAGDFAYGDYASTGLRTMQLWLSGLDEGESLRAVFGRALLPLNIETTDPAGYSNGPELGQTHYAPATALFPVFPEMQWDTFVTLGRSPDTTVSAGFPDTALAGGGSTLLDAHVSWFDLIPSTPETGVDGRILFAQFSFGADYALNLDEMQVNVLLADAFGVEREIWDVPIVPGPGGGAGAVLAGIVLSRRRRASRAARS